MAARSADTPAARQEVGWAVVKDGVERLDEVIAREGARR